MSALIKGLLVKQAFQKNTASFLNLARQGSHWNKDFKPGKYPTTDKEREAAAKKYNLLPEEYRPYADDGMGYGDYPKLPTGLGVEAKCNYYPYDYPELKRNFNEPIHAHVDIYGEDRYSQPQQPRYANSTYFLAFLGVMAFWFALYYWLEDKKMFRPVKPKQYPGPGKVHYTFEPAD